MGTLNDCKFLYFWTKYRVSHYFKEYDTRGILIRVSKHGIMGVTVHNKYAYLDITTIRLFSIIYKQNKKKGFKYLYEIIKNSKLSS